MRPCLLPRLHRKAGSSAGRQAGECGDGQADRQVREWADAWADRRSGGWVDRQVVR